MSILIEKLTFVQAEFHSMQLAQHDHHCPAPTSPRFTLSHVIAYLVTGNMNQQTDPSFHLSVPNDVRS